MGQWIYDGKFLEGSEDFLGQYKAFVYVITNLQSGKCYYGKKRLHFISHKKRQRRKNRIKVVRASDWLQYWGSSDHLQADIDRYGQDNFQREIVRFCRTLSESNYYELKYQMEHDVLLHPDKYYNEYVGGRISRRQMGVK